MRFAAIVAVALISVSVGAQSGLEYPTTRTVEHVDTYHGTTVPDPYRWLEDDMSAETAKWVEAQNRVTFAYLERIPFRAQLKTRLERLYDYPRYAGPSTKRDLVFFYRNDGLQNQNVLYVQKGLEGKPELLLDPNTWSSDGTVRLMSFTPSRDAKHAVYGISKSGSDWLEYNVLDLATRKPLADKIEWAKVSNVAWRGSGFYYSRYPAPPPGKELSSSNDNHQVFYHRLGTPQNTDELVFEDLEEPAALSSARDDRGREVRDPLLFPTAAPANRATPCSFAICRALSGQLSCRSFRQSRTTRSLSSTISAESFSFTPTRMRPMAVCSASRSGRPGRSPTGKPCSRRDAIRSKTSRLREESYSRRT